MTTPAHNLTKPAGLILAVALAGCAPTPSSTEDPSERPTPVESNSSSSEGCYIHLFDGDDFDEGDDNFVLTEPGKYENLDNLPGAEQGWTDEADSVRVGNTATVTIYSETGFAGESTTLQPGSEHPSLDHEPASLEMTCD